jgi:hypothetical protein
MLRSSGAVDLLTGDGPFTVFVPTNDAFGKVPDPQMNGWLSQTGQTNLAKVLSYHMVPGKLFASNLEGKGPVATLSGAEVNFTDTNGLKVNASGLLGRNMEATNGIVHALDTVLAPPANAMAASASPVSAGSTATTATPIAQADGNSEVTAAKTEAATDVVPATTPVTAPLPANKTTSLL